MLFIGDPLASRTDGSCTDGSCTHGSRIYGSLTDDSWPDGCARVGQLGVDY